MSGTNFQCWNSSLKRMKFLGIWNFHCWNSSLRRMELVGIWNLQPKINLSFFYQIIWHLDTFESTLRTTLLTHLRSTDWMWQFRVYLYLRLNSSNNWHLIDFKFFWFNFLCPPSPTSPLGFCCCLSSLVLQ